MARNFRAGQRKYLSFSRFRPLPRRSPAAFRSPSGRGPGYAELSTDDPKASEANIASLDAVVAAHPSDAETYNTRGVAYAKIGRYSQAIADFSQSVKLDPNHASAYTNRALAERQPGANDAAMQDFTRALQANPNHAPAYLGRANLERASGQLDAALAISTRRSASIPRAPRPFTRGV